MVNFASGTAAAVCATLVTQPADVIRTRMQLVAAKGTHMGPMQTLHTVLQTGGPQALLVGTLPRVGLPFLFIVQLLVCQMQHAAALAWTQGRIWRASCVLIVFQPCQHVPVP